MNASIGGQDETVYIDKGYKSRSHYLKSLSEEHDVPLNDVVALADLLGPSEDFDGLIVQLEDYYF